MIQEPLMVSFLALCCSLVFANGQPLQGLLYNIYPDKALGLNFIPQSVYDMQSDFYKTKANKYGVVLDTRGTLTKTDWELFAAAVAKPDTKAMFISLIAKWINETPTWRAFTDLYDTNTENIPATSLPLDRLWAVCLHCWRCREHFCLSEGSVS